MNSLGADKSKWLWHLDVEKYVMEKTMKLFAKTYPQPLYVVFLVSVFCLLSRPTVKTLKKGGGLQVVRVFFSAHVALFLLE